LEKLFVVCALTPLRPNPQEEQATEAPHVISIQRELQRRRCNSDDCLTTALLADLGAGTDPSEPAHLCHGTRSRGRQRRHPREA